MIWVKKSCQQANNHIQAARAANPGLYHAFNFTAQANSMLRPIETRPQLTEERVLYNYI